jgi:hypothetical protein
MGDRDWKLAIAVLVSLMAGVLLAGSGILPAADGQSEGRAGNVICVVGEERNGYAPIVLVDTREEALLVYRYSYADYQLELGSVRTYAFDKQLREYNIDGPTVEAVARQVQGRR